jgi:hypothetical protein
MKLKKVETSWGNLPVIFKRKSMPSVKFKLGQQIFNYE